MKKFPKLFDFSRLKPGSTAWYELRVDKCFFIVDGYEEGVSPEMLKLELGASNTIDICKRIEKHKEHKRKKIVDMEFYKAYCGELYDILAENGIKSFKKLEKELKNDYNLKKLTGIGACYRRPIIDIYEKWAKKSVKKEKNVVKKESK